MNRKKIITYITSLFLSITCIFSYQILKYYTKGPSQVIKHIYFNIFVVIAIIVLSIILYLLLSKILSKLKEKSFSSSKKVMSSKNVFIISFIIIFLVGLLFLLTVYPGTAMVDSYQLIANPVGFSIQYPLVYSILSSKIFYFIYRLSGSMNLAFFTLGFIQLVIMSFILSYTIKWLHEKLKSNYATTLVIIYFNIFIIFPNLNIAHLRDTLFSGFFLLLFTIIYDVCESNGDKLRSNHFLVKIALTLTGLLLSRNNGLIIVSIVIIYLLIRYRKYYKPVLYMIYIVVFVSLVPRFLPNNYNESLFQESVANPFQQVAYSINEGNISDEDKAIIEKIVPIEVVNERYNAFTFDNLKWSITFRNFKFNELKEEFIHVWLKNMIPNYKEYTKAYIVNTCDLWAFMPFKFKQGTVLSLQTKDIAGMQYFEKLDNTQILPNFLYKGMLFIINNQSVFFSNGMLFWIYVFLALVLIYKGKKKYLPIFIPFIVIWINLMLMAPLASAFRYMAMFGYCLPFLVALIFYEKEKLNN